MRLARKFHSVGTLRTPERRMAWLVFALGLLLNMMPVPAYSQSASWSADTWEQSVDQLPEPRDKPESWPRSCLSSTKEFSDTRRLLYASPSVEARYRANVDFARVLGMWGVRRLHMPSDSRQTLCTDYRYVLSRMQEAAGDEATGVLGERDLSRLDAAIRHGNEKAVQAVQDREKGLLTVFGIPLGAPLRMMECPMPMQGVVQRPKHVPTTCKQKLGRGDEHVPTVTVYFSEADSPAWLGTIGQSNSLDLPNPSLRLDVRNWNVTAIHFESRHELDSIAVEALTAKFGVKPRLVKPQGETCVNFMTGQIGQCTPNFHHIHWNVKDFIVRGECNGAVFRCQYVIQLASEATAQKDRMQKESAEQRERALRSGRPL